MKHGSTLLFSFVVLAASAAHADDPKVHAKEAYSRGLAAHDAHDYKAAARAFTEADTALPSPTALGAALDDAVLADDPVLGAELIERGNRPGATPELTKSLAEARMKLGGRAGKIRLVCPAGSTCSALVDERSTTREIWVAPGSHSVTMRVDATTKERTIDVHAGETIVLEPEKPPAVVPPPPPPPPPVSEPAPSDKGKDKEKAKGKKSLPPVVTFAGVGITLLLTGVTIAGGFAAKGAHDDFVAKGCNKGPGPDCEGLRDDGLDYMIGTNLFLGLSILSAVATAGIGLFMTDWHASASAGANGATLGIGRNF